MGVNLIKTRTGSKIHIANGAHIYCGIVPDGKCNFILTGSIPEDMVCQRCTMGMDVKQFGVEGIKFVKVMVDESA